MLGGVQNLYGLWNCFNFSNQADEYIFFSSYMGRDIIVVVVDYQFHNLNNTAVMCTSYSQVKNMQNLKNKRGSFTAFNNINILFWMPSSAVSNQTKPRRCQNQNTPLALRYQPWSLIQGSWYDEANANASHKLKHLADICSFLDIQKQKRAWWVFGSQGLVFVDNRWLVLRYPQQKVGIQEFLNVQHEIYLEKFSLVVLHITAIQKRA